MHDGFSGGAFVDTSGGLVGVATAAAIRGLGVVIPASIAWKHRGDGAGARQFEARLSGRRRAAGGVAGAPSAAAHDREHGLLVVGVTNGSPAAAAGLMVGDVLLDFDGHRVESPEDLLDLLRGDRVGRALPLRVLRGGAHDRGRRHRRRAAGRLMRVLLVGSPAERQRLRAELDGSAFDVVGEFSSLSQAEASAADADVIVLGRTGPVERPRSDRFAEPVEQLTAREIQVLELLAEGLSNKAIAARLAISDQTVKFHVASISGKLGATNRTDAVRRAVRRGLIAI